MPKLLKVNNIGTKGLNTDIPPWDLPYEFLSSGFNFKVRNNNISAAGGSEEISVPPVPIKIGMIATTGALSGGYLLVAGVDSVYAFDGITWTNISSVQGYPGLSVDDELNWTSCLLGQIPIVNNPQAQPEYWSPQSPGQVLQPLPWSPGVTWQDRGISAKVFRSHKNFLFAMDIQDGSIEKPSTYRWSTAADINGLPYTWDETDLSGLAGEASLGGDSGRIIDGLSLRDSFVLYSEKGIDILDYTGDEFIWRRREVSKSTGLLARNCVVEVKGSHFFISDGDIVKTDGTNIKSILYDRIRNNFIANFDSEYYNRSFVIKNQVSKEIWFCVPEEGEQYPNRAYVYNWRDDSWAIRDLPPGTVSAAYSPRAQPPLTWETWQGTWEEQTRIWNSRFTSLLSDTILGANNTDTLLALEPKEVRTSGPLVTTLERTDLPLEGIDKFSTITRVYPRIEGVQSVVFQFGSQKYAGGPVTWKPAFTFLPGTDRKIDIRTTGALHCWRLTAVDSGDWRFSGMDFEYEEAGFR